MDRLTKLCNKYGTDKGTEAGSSHGFSVFYEPSFLAWVANIAVGVLFVKIFEAIEKSSPEGKFKATQKAAEELSKAMDEAKQKADDLKSSFDQYGSVIEKLKQCTKGT